MEGYTKDKSVSAPRLLFTHEQHVIECDGRFYNPSGMIAYEGMCNYLHTVKDALVVLRSVHMDEADPAWQRLDGPGIAVQPIPEFSRPEQLILGIPKILCGIWRAISKTNCHIVRMPGPTGALVAFVLMLRMRRYGVEMAGHYDSDLGDTLRKRHFGPVWMSRAINGIVSFIVRHAYAVAYRSNYLRRLYPTAHPERQWVFSGAQLNLDIISGPRDENAFAVEPFRIVSVGRVAVGKGYPLLIRMFARLREQTCRPITLEIVGEGDEMELVRTEVARLGLGECVSLPGRIPWGPQLFRRLDGAHLFVMASLSDGMPRSVIEAMARGMPVISTTAGGIPELVDAEYLVSPGDEDALLARISPLVGNTAVLARMSQRSFERSKEHWPERLDAAKRAFWACMLQ